MSGMISHGGRTVCSVQVANLVTSTPSCVFHPLASLPGWGGTLPQGHENGFFSWWSTYPWPWGQCHCSHLPLHPSPAWPQSWRTQGGKQEPLRSWRRLQPSPRPTIPAIMNRQGLRNSLPIVWITREQQDLILGYREILIGCFKNKIEKIKKR